MSEQTQPTPQESKQSLLNRIKAAKKMVEMLSEEELESIVGGLVCLENTTSMPLSETKHFPSNNKYLENCNTSIDL